MLRLNEDCSDPADDRGSVGTGISLVEDYAGTARRVDDCCGDGWVVSGIVVDYEGC